MSFFGSTDLGTPPAITPMRHYGPMTLAPANRPGMRRRPLSAAQMAQWQARRQAFLAMSPDQRQAFEQQQQALRQQYHQQQQAMAQTLTPQPATAAVQGLGWLGNVAHDQAIIERELARQTHAERMAHYQRAHMSGLGANAKMQAQHQEIMALREKQRASRQAHMQGLGAANPHQAQMQARRQEVADNRAKLKAMAPDDRKAAAKQMVADRREKLKEAKAAKTAMQGLDDLAAVNRMVKKVAHKGGHKVKRMAGMGWDLEGLDDLGLVYYPPGYFQRLQSQLAYRAPSYPYASGNYSYYQYNYPYYGYPNQSAQYQYPPQSIPYGGTDYGAIQCNQQGGIYDATRMTCSTGSTVGLPYGLPYGTTPGQPPNVVGQAKWAAVSVLNAAGYRVWLLNEDGVSGGVPPAYDTGRVDITVSNGVVSGQSVG